MKRTDSRVPQTIIAIYSSDIKKLSDFYMEALDLKVIEARDEYICLGAGDIEINVIRMNWKQGAGTEAAEAFSIREETPLKCSFIVDSFEQVRRANLKYGGGLKNEEEAWEWRGYRHLDGHDPEGNVVQFRVMNRNGQESPGTSST